MPITWWFTAPDAPLAGRHQFGSLNWSKPSLFGTDLGEVEGAKRPWVTGKKPVGACGSSPPVTVQCHPLPLPSTMYAILTIGAVAYTRPLVYAAGQWTAAFSPPGSTCGALQVQLFCEELPLPSGGIGFLWQLEARTFDSAGNGVTSDTFGFNPTSSPFRLQVDLPHYWGGCLGGAGPIPNLVVTELQSGRLRAVSLV